MEVVHEVPPCSFRTALIAASLLAAAGCKGEGDDAKPSRGEEERTIVTVQSYVYATGDETSGGVVGRIREQIRSAFGALKSARVTGSNKEESNDPGSEIYREPLVVVREDGTEEVVFRVWFRYSDEVFAPASVPRGVPMLVGGIHRQDDAHFTQIVTACTANTAREREYKGRLQTVFDGALQSCQDAILKEQAIIDAARVRLDAPEDEIVPEELDRVYVPVVARLLERKASQMGAYPRFESVIPQPVRAISAVSSPGRSRRPAAGSTEGSDDGLFGDDDPARPGEEPRPDKPAAIVVPGGGAVGAPAPHGGGDDEPHDPNAPPDPMAGVPVVVAAAPGAPNAAAPPQPPAGTGDSGFAWEDLLDKKFLALWVAVIALYPLLRRRSS